MDQQSALNKKGKSVYMFRVRIAALSMSRAGKKCWPGRDLS